MTLPRALDSFFWLEIRGSGDNQAVWCKCCNVRVQQRSADGGWENSALLWAHFDTKQHRENYELARLAGETC